MVHPIILDTLPALLMKNQRYKKYRTVFHTLNLLHSSVFADQRIKVKGNVVKVWEGQNTFKFKELQLIIKA